jgi:dTDP-glucose pyrophosphorylase
MSRYNPVFCILAAGLGTRLGYLTKSVNKALLPIDNKAIISHIIDKVPENYPIVIATGYQGESLVDYCRAAHPNRIINYVSVEPFQGPGSGPGYSLLKCRFLINRPFYLCTADTLIEESLPEPGEDNWIGISSVGDPEPYCTVSYSDESVISIKNKEKSGFDHAFIGLAYFYDHDTFFRQLKEGTSEREEEGFVHAFSDPSQYNNLKVKHFNSWMDTGTLEGYKEAKFRLEKNPPLVAEKEYEEYTYFIEDKTIKLCFDALRSQKKHSRYVQLRQFVPPLIYNGNYVQAYNWIEGKTLYEVDDLCTYNKFSIWCKENFWNRKVDIPSNFRDDCSRFYYNKTKNRLFNYLSKKSNENITLPRIINGKSVDSIEYYFDKIPWESLKEGVPVFYHGDLQYDNVIFNEKEEFVLIDWREEFGSSVNCGDLYYELSKLYWGMLLPYHELKRDNFSYSNNKGIVRFSYPRIKSLEDYSLIFKDFVAEMNCDFEKVKLITALIWINMSPLHKKDLGDLLFSSSLKLLSDLFD